MKEIVTQTDYKLQQIDEINVYMKRIILFIGCLYLSVSGNITNIPLVMFMYHMYMIFHNYIDSNPPIMGYLT